MTDYKELLKETRDLLVLCTMLDKSDHCQNMVNKIDRALQQPDVSDSYKQMSNSDKNFINTLAESVVLNGWVDESCGNFVGWTKQYEEFSITIHRENTDIGGLYHFAKMKKGYRPSYEYKSNLIDERGYLSLLKISNLISLFDNNYH